jgi:hypothetical protein
LNIIRDIFMRRGSGILLQVFIVFIILAFIAAAGCLEPEALPPASPPEPASTPVSVPAGHPPHYLPLYTSSLVVMQKNLEMQKDQLPGMTLSIPTYLPEGFFFFFGTLAQGNLIAPQSDEGYCSFTYQRGEDEWVTLTERSRDVVNCPDKSEFQVAEAGSLLANKGATGELSWGGDGWCYSLSGSVPREDLEKIAASVKPIPYREGVIPPYEYQPPAHPLVRTFSVNRSSTTNGVTVTVESLTCTAEMCAAKIRVGTGSSPSLSPLPVVTTMPPFGSSPNAEWRVDGGQPLRTMPGGGKRFNATSISWDIEPLPETSREVSVTFSRVNGITGPWQVSIPLDNRSGSGKPDTTLTGDSS